ncbi:MAG: FeoA family protein [Acidobacteriota bacterium]
MLTAVPLTELDRGQSGELLGSELAGVDRQLLAALGLCESSRLRLCKTGDPWIVQVCGTRIGLSDAVARRLFVIPDP